MNSPDQQKEHKLRDRIRWIVWGLVVPIHIGLLGWMACCLSPTSDEVAHLAAGVRILSLGRFDLYPVNPPLVKTVAALPVMLNPPQTDWRACTSEIGARNEWTVGRELMRANVPRFRWDFVLARWACVPFSLLGIVLCYYWSESLYSPQAGLVASLLWCFSPNLLGNAALITPDVPATALGLATMFQFRRWLSTATWSNALGTGILLGLTELSKMTWLILYPLLPLIWVLNESFSPLRRRESSRNAEISWTPLTSTIASFATDELRGERTFLARGWQLLFSLFISLEVLNAGYLFNETCLPLEGIEFVSQTLTGEADASRSGNRFRGSWWGKMPVPLPREYLRGLDLQRRDFEGNWKPLVSYLRGVQQRGGWIYYYLYAGLVKIPTGIGVIVTCWILQAMMHRRRADLASWWELTLLAMPPMILFLLVSSQTGFSRYFRYVLPCSPFLFIIVSSLWNSHSGVVSKWIRCLATAGLVGAILSSLSVYPHSLSYFNFLAGGPTNGHWHLLDSNIDWGQDLYSLRNWQRRHPKTQPLYLAYSGAADPMLFELDFLPGEQAFAKSSDKPASGWYAVSVNRLHGYDEEHPRWTRFLHQIPVDRAGYSIRIYQIPEQAQE